MDDLGFSIDNEHDLIVARGDGYVRYFDANSAWQLSLPEVDARLTRFAVALEDDGGVLLVEVLNGHTTIYPEAPA